MKLFEINLFGWTIAPSFYGLMYVIGIFAGYYIIKQRKFLDEEKLDTLLLYIFFGILIGGRLGYVGLYNFDYYTQHILEILQIWKGGMSFHGGVVGVVIAMWLFARNYKISFYDIADEIAYVSTIGLFFGRIGNYYNKELLGFKYNGPLSIEKDGVHYFPTPLLEATLEGLLLFVLLSYFYANKRFSGQIGAIFMFLYGCFRLGIERGFRMPDTHIGYIYSDWTLGAILSITMILVGIALYGYLWQQNSTDKKKKKSKK